MPWHHFYNSGRNDFFEFAQNRDHSKIVGSFVYHLNYLEFNVKTYEIHEKITGKMREIFEFYAYVKTEIRQFKQV